MLSTSQVAVKAKWDSYTYPVLPGTPLGANGAVANTSSAVGIVMERIDKKPDNPDEELSIMAGGIVDKAELGYDLSAAAVKALNGIVFRGYDVDPLPAVTAEDNGKVLGVADGAWAKVAGGGGGGDVLVVPVAVDLSGGTPEYNTDISIDDVATACADGKGVMYVLNIDVPNVALFSLHSISVVMVRTEDSATAEITMPESGEFPTTYYHTADGFSSQAPNVGG